MSDQTNEEQKKQVQDSVSGAPKEATQQPTETGSDLLTKSLLDDIQEQALKIQESIEKRLEPIDQLKEINQLLNKQNEQLWTLLREATPARKVEFYRKVFKAPADKMLAEKMLSQPAYLPQILRFFRNILVNFFPRDIEEEILAEVVHSLFNLDAPLYTTALQSTYRKQANQQDQSINGQHLEEDEYSLEERRLKSEWEWRQSLKPGDLVDCFSQKIIQNNRVSHWAVGQIATQLEQDQFYVSFKNEQYLQNKLVTRFGAEIAKPGTFTDDFDWRFDLKPGDQFDCLDSEGVWYKSTCLDVKITEHQNQTEHKEVYVGFRVYDEEEGHKVDDDGRKFIGWSNRYDEWVSVTSPTLQRLGTLVKFYKIAGKATMQYDIVVDDMVDTIINSLQIKQWCVYRNNFFSNLRCIPDYLNEFGMRDGFEKILKFVSQIEERRITMKHLFHLMDFLSKTMPIWHRQFACYYIPKLKEVFEKAMLYTNPENTGPTQLKFTKESLSGFQKSFQNVLRRHYPSDIYACIMADLLLKIGFSLMKSDKLEQRIQGLKEIVEQIKGTKFSLRKTLNVKEVIASLKEHDIFEMIFGENYHIQLIQRSQEIIKFFINEKEISEKEIDYIWKATQKDQQTKMEIYKIISETAILFKNEEIELLVERFAQVPPEQFVEKEVECVYELSKYSYRQSNFSVTAAKLFWEIAVQERPYKKQIIEMAMDKFNDLIRNWERDQKGEYLYNCIEKIHDHKSSLQCIKIMSKILEQVPSYKINNQPTIYETACSLIQDYFLLKFMIEDIIHYSEQANALWAKGILNSENIDLVEVFDLPFTHRNHVFGRLNFIRSLLQYTQNQIQQDHLDLIWDILMVKTKISIDSDIFFNWFKQLLSDQNKLSPELIRHFFETKVCSDEVNFKNIRKAGFECISHIFLFINEQEDKLNVISQPTQTNQSQKLEFRLHVPPRELTGIHLIWKLLSECDKKNLDLTALVLDLITKIYHCLSPSIQSQIHEIEDQFCSEALQKLEAVLLDPKATDEEKKQFAHMMIVMLKSFFDDSERNGCGLMRMHAALERGVFIEKLVIQNNITSMKNTPKYIVINAYSNMTVWELKKIIADKTKQSPLRIQLQRGDQKKKIVSDNDNAKLLRDMKFENYELLFAQKKPLLYQPRVPLLNKKKELMPEVKDIFDSWYNKFSNEEGYMTPANCVEFIRSSTNDMTVMTTDSRVVRLFNEYDKDMDGRLTREDFMDFYTDRALNKPDLVWSNLNAHGIGNDLRPMVNQYVQDDPNELKDASVLPRYKLSNDIGKLNELFKLIKNSPTAATEEMWQFLCHLRTNPAIYSRLLSLNNIEEFASLDNTLHQLMYSLQILESFINDYQAKNEQTLTCYYLESQDQNQQFPPLVDLESPAATNEDQDIREAQSAAPESGKAIPLPPSGTNVFTNTATNVPEPPTQVPFIGPVPPPSSGAAGAVAGSEQIRVKEMIDSFKGHIISEPLMQQHFTAEELIQASEGGLEGPNSTADAITFLKQNWIQNFVQAGGFSILMQLLQIMNLQILDGSKISQEKHQNKSKIEKECLNQLLKIMKVLLMSSFIANSPSGELNNELQRKLSHKDATASGEEENAQPAQSQQLQQVQKPEGDQQQVPLLEKNKIKDEQEDTAKLYQPLIQILQGTLGTQILSSIDFKQFQDQLLLIVQYYLKKKDKIGADDKNIIDSGVSLWIACIVFNPELLQHIYDEGKEEQSKGMDLESGISTESVQAMNTTNMLIEDGLLCQHYGVRISFKEALRFVCQSVKSQALSEQPYQFFLRTLLQGMDAVEYKSRESKHFFQLVKLLMNQYFEAQKSRALDFKPLFDHKELLIKFTDKLISYQSREKKSSFVEDTNLVGYLDVIHELIKNNPDAIGTEQYYQLLVELVEKCLFYFSPKPLETHITKEVDIVAYEKPFINKCQSTDARNSAYALLTTICTINPGLVGEIIAKYWQPILSKVKKPKKSGFAPRTEGRSFYGFCGLKNLGCICYMNAMIQQFFHIPPFRYSLLAADDRQPPSWNTFENEQVDDNMLHQLMKLMGSLELSERQDYNPREFCFSFKDFTGQPTNVRIQQDAQEFLSMSFDRLEHLLARTSQKYLVQNIFGGKNCIMRICKSCGNMNQRSEDFCFLSLEVKNQKTINDGLKKFISGEIINDFQCEACNQRVDVERKTVLEKLPNMLIVHLQRIVYDFDSLSNQKLNSRVEFPNILNLKQFTLDEILKQEKELLKKAQKQKRKQEHIKEQQKVELIRRESSQKAEDGKLEDEEENLSCYPSTTIATSNSAAAQQENTQMVESSEDEEEETPENAEMAEEVPEEEFQYKLVGVVVHMGTADAGHYISYINISRGQKPEESPEWLQTEKEKWLEFNDSQVKDYKQSYLPP